MPASRSSMPSSSSATQMPRVPGAFERPRDGLGAVAVGVRLEHAHTGTPPAARCITRRLWRRFARFTSARVGRTASDGAARCGRSTRGSGVASGSGVARGLVLAKRGEGHGVLGF